jgi:hypothetical protein
MLENLTDHLVPEKVYFCESHPKPMDLINLTKKEDKKREDGTPSIQVPLPAVRKKEQIEIVAVRKFLRKSDIIPEKEIPEKEIPENVSAYNFVRKLFFSNFAKVLQIKRKTTKDGRTLQITRQNNTSRHLRVHLVCL